MTETMEKDSAQIRAEVREHLRERADKTVRRRMATSTVMSGVCWAAIVVAAVPLVALLFELFHLGWSSISSWSFYSTYSQQPSGNNLSAGGAMGQIIGSVALVVYAVIISVPIGVTMGVFLAESQARAANWLRIVAQTMVSAPSVLMGLFIFKLILLQFGWQPSALAGSLALSILMLPVIAIATEIAVRSVNPSLREAGLALGARPSTTSLRIVLPAALSGIVTGSILAVSRAVGETAPILFVIGGISSGFGWKPFDQVNALPVLIYLNVKQGSYPSQISQAWGMALLLVIVVFVLSLFARIWANRNQKEQR